LQPFYGNGYHGASLAWKVEIYQYHESKSESCHKNNDGSKDCHTTYSYSAEWESSPIDSSYFHDGSYSNHGTRLPSNLRSGTADAADHSLVMHQPGSSSGPAFALPQDIAQQLPSHTVLPQTSPSPEHHSQNDGPWIGGGIISPYALQRSGQYLTTASGSPRIGDIRVSVSGKMAHKASVAAKQTSWPSGPGFSFTSYPPQTFDMWGRKTYAIARLESGTESKKAFIEDWHSENQSMAFILRIITLIGFVCACAYILGPVSKAADMLRCINPCTCGLGTLLDDAAQCVIYTTACGLGCGVWSVIVAVSWFFVHPTISLALLVSGIAAFFIFPQIVARSGAKKVSAREQDGYVKITDMAFGIKKVQPAPYQNAMV